MVNVQLYLTLFHIKSTNNHCHYLLFAKLFCNQLQNGINYLLNRDAASVLMPQSQGCLEAQQCLGSVLPRLKFQMPQSRLGLETERLGLGLGLDTQGLGLGLGTSALVS